MRTPRAPGHARTRPPPPRAATPRPHATRPRPPAGRAMTWAAERPRPASRRGSRPASSVRAKERSLLRGGLLLRQGHGDLFILGVVDGHLAGRGLVAALD